MNFRVLVLTYSNTDGVRWRMEVDPTKTPFGYKNRVLGCTWNGYDVLQSAGVFSGASGHPWPIGTASVSLATHMCCNPIVGNDSLLPKYEIHTYDTAPPTLSNVGEHRWCFGVQFVYR